MKRNETVTLLICGLAFAVVMACLLKQNSIDVAQAIQIIITFVLVCVTTMYVKRTADIADATKEQAEATKQQAEAGVKMAEEMKEQRISTSRPIVLQEACEFRGDNLNDFFKIYNVGKGPAIELEIILLGKGKQRLYFEKRTIFNINNESKLDSYSKGLSEHFNSMCYLLCQYRSIDTKQLWYQTWLPFIPRENVRKNGIIVTPQELEFHEVTTKESF